MGVIENEGVNAIGILPWAIGERAENVRNAIGTSGFGGAMKPFGEPRMFEEAFSCVQIELSLKRGASVATVNEEIDGKCRFNIRSKGAWSDEGELGVRGDTLLDEVVPELSGDGDVIVSISKTVAEAFELETGIW